MRTKEKIIEAAFELFSDRGYEATTTKNIAEKAGVNEVTIFRHFDTKKKLFRRTVERHIEEGTEMFVEEIPESTDDMDEDMMRLGMKIHEGIKKSGDFHRLLLSEYDRDPELFQKTADSREKFVEVLSDYLEEAKKKGKIRKDLDTKVAAHSFLSFFLFNLTEKAFLEDRTIIKINKQEIKEHINIFLEGIENDD